MTFASVLSICNAPGNAQAGHGRCHSHIMFEINQLSVPVRVLCFQLSIAGHKVYLHFCRYGAGKVSSGANVDGAPAPEEFEENGKEEEVGEFGFHTLVRLLVFVPKQQLVNACLASS